jgi:hypothetical protein
MSTTPSRPEPADQDKPSRVGKFIQTYHSFLSTFVIGAAGLIATSIWQYKQSEIARRQAESQQHIATTQAENSWRIERAEILSKNLQVLATSGESSVEQRYGVLLSLTRGNILDPELAVSYALELGKDNSDYMKSVLSNTTEKSYSRLANAFELTCTQRFGMTRDVPICKADMHADRAAAIADLFADETEAARKHGELGPMVVLQDERDVQATPARLAWLFTPYLSTLYERRQWKEIQKFEAQSVGARLIAALVLGPARRNELVAASEVADVDKFHDARVDWLLQYLVGSSCDPECKAKLGDIMVTFQAESMGRFDAALRTLLSRPRVEVGNALGRMHTRLLACQVDVDDLVALRDRVLVPALGDAVGKAKPDTQRIEELLSLLVLVPEPKAPDDTGSGGPQHQAWQETLAKAHDVMKDQFRRAYNVRRAAAEASRQNPSPALRKALFCSAAQTSPLPDDFGED